MVKDKVRDYGVSDYRPMLANAISRLPEIIHSGHFRAQMSRFVDTASIDSTLANNDYLDYTAAEVGRQLALMMKSLSPGLQP